MSCRYSSCLSFSSPNMRSEQHLGEADDGVERRPQLVGHVGARNSDLWRFAISSCSVFSRSSWKSRVVLDGDDGLVGERPKQLDFLVRERLRRAPGDRDHPDRVGARAASAPGGGSGSPPAARARASPASRRIGVHVGHVGDRSVPGRARRVRGRRPARGRVPPHGGRPPPRSWTGRHNGGRPDHARRRSRGHRRGARTGAQWCRTRAAYRWASSKWRAGSPPSPSAARAFREVTVCDSTFCSRLAWAPAVAPPCC